VNTSEKKDLNLELQLEDQEDVVGLMQSQQNMQ